MGRRTLLSQDEMENNQGIIRFWLDLLPISKADLLMWTWRLNAPGAGPDEDNKLKEDKRQKVLKQWIAASKDDDYISWEGCRRLLDAILEETGREGLPNDLSQWAFDVARKRIKEPKLSHGSHKTDKSVRDELIHFVVNMCHKHYGSTLNQTYQEVADYFVYIEADAIRKIYKRQEQIQSTQPSFFVSILPPERKINKMDDCH